MDQWVKLFYLKAESGLNYQDSIDFIFGQLPSYQLTGSGAYKENLNNINALLNALDRPRRKQNLFILPEPMVKDLVRMP